MTDSLHRGPIVGTIPWPITTFDLYFVVAADSASSRAWQRRKSPWRFAYQRRPQLVVVNGWDRNNS